MRQTILEKGPDIRRALLTGMVVVVPLLVVRAVNDPINVPKLGVLTMGVAAVAAIKAIEVIQGSEWATIRRMLVPAGAILVPLALAWAASDYPGWALLGEYRRFQGLIPYLVVVSLSVLVADAFKGRAMTLAWAATTAGGIIGAIAILEALGIRPLGFYTGGFAAGGVTVTVGNPNFVGGFLAIALPFPVVLYLLDPTTRRWSGTAFVATAGGLIASFSQGPYAAALAGGALVAGFLFRHKHRLVLPAGLVVAGGMAVVVIVSAFAVVIAPQRSEVLPQTIRLRGYWWQSAAEMAMDSPIVGHGPNVFGVLGVQYRPLQEAIFSGFEFPDDPHSVLFSMLANAGVLGAFGYMALLGWIVWFAWRYVDPDDVVSVAFLGAITAYFIQSLASLDEISLRMLFWVSLGGLVASTYEVPKASTSKRRTSRRQSPAPVRVPGAVALVALVPLVITWWGFSFMRADAHVRSARLLARTGDLENGFDRAYDALSFRNDPDYRHILGFDLGNGVLSLAIEGEAEFERVNDLFSYVRTFPDLPGVRDHARLLQARAAKLEAGDRSGLDAKELAARRYLQVVAIDDVSPGPRNEAAAALLDLDRYRDVIDLLDDYLRNVYAEDPGLWAQYGFALANMGLEEEAKDALARADPNNPLVQEAQQIIDGAG